MPRCGAAEPRRASVPRICIVRRLEHRRTSQPRPGLGSWPSRNRSQLRPGDGQGQGGRTDRPHALAQRRRVLLGFHHGHATERHRSRPSAGRPEPALPTPARIVAMDWDWIDENDGGPTYMSLAASSHHPGGVNALFADGSVRFIKNTVNPTTWRASGPSPAAKSSRRIPTDPYRIARPRVTPHAQASGNHRARSLTFPEAGHSPRAFHAFHLTHGPLARSCDPRLIGLRLR